MYHFCTYFDQHYLARGLALYDSLQKHVEQFRLYVLCFDNETYAFLSKLNEPGLIPISLDKFEEGDIALLLAKRNRSQIEYYFTCTPSLALYVLDNFPAIDIVTYIDADLFFFANPAPIYDELGEQSILIIGHRFPEQRKYQEKLVGVYNVGYLSFRNDLSGRKCLTWWRERCIEWCYDRLEDGKFGDQKYLDDWSTRFERVVVLQQKGAGIAPWNVSNYDIQVCRGLVQIDSDSLIFYHFHNLKIINLFMFDLGTDHWAAKQAKIIREELYAPYLHNLQTLLPKTLLSTWIDVRSKSFQTQWQKLRKALIYGRIIILFKSIAIEIYLYPLFCQLLKSKNVTVRNLKAKLTLN